MSHTPQLLQIADIIRIVPFTVDFRARLVEVYPAKLSADQRVDFERYLWKMYYLNFDLVYEEHLQYLIEQHPDGLPEGYHDELLETTHKSIHERDITTQENSKMQKVREDIEKIISTLEP